MLGLYFFEHDIGSFDTIVATRDDGTEHEWLAKGKLIVDITADQFPEVKEQVIVARGSAWHAAWSRPQRTPVKWEKCLELKESLRYGPFYSTLVSRTLRILEKVQARAK